MFCQKDSVVTWYQRLGKALAALFSLQKEVIVVLTRWRPLGKGNKLTTGTEIIEISKSRKKKEYP